MEPSVEACNAFLTVDDVCVWVQLTATGGSEGHRSRWLTHLEIEATRHWRITAAMPVNEFIVLLVSWQSGQHLQLSAHANSSREYMCLSGTTVLHTLTSMCGPTLP